MDFDLSNVVVEEEVELHDLWAPLLTACDDDAVQQLDRKQVEEVQEESLDDIAESKLGRGKRKITRKRTFSVSGKKRKSCKEDFEDPDEHARHRLLNNRSVKKCREKKKREYDAVLEENLTLKAQNEALRDAGKKVLKQAKSKTVVEPAINQDSAEINALKELLAQKDQEIAELKGERDFGFGEVRRLEKELKNAKSVHDLWKCEEGDEMIEIEVPVVVAAGAPAKNLNLQIGVAQSAPSEEEVASPEFREEILDYFEQIPADA